MRVAFRVDASAQIGTGHFKRCLSLAYAIIQLGGEVALVWRDHGLDCAAELERSGLRSLRLLPPPVSFHPGKGPAHAAWAGVDPEQDVAETVACLANWRPDWLVIDHYGFDAVWHGQARQALGCRLAVIDDLGDRLIHADLLVDHNPAPDHRAKYAASAGQTGRLLGGARFALLGPGYRDLEPITVGEGVRSLGIFMGGADAADHSRMALAACRAAGFRGTVEVVTTSANPNLAALTEAVAADPDAVLLKDLPSLAEFFASHDLQIGAGGGATWERCRAGVPALVLATAANQTVVTAALRRAGAALTLDHPTGDSMQDCLTQLLRDPALRLALAQGAGRLVDGRGCERVALAMARDHTSVRPATVADAELVHRWRNDPATRAVSGDQSEIDLAAHMRWFASSIAPGSGRHILVGEIGGAPVGVVRFDSRDVAEDRLQYEVSIFLDPDLYGLGLGPPMLRAAEEAMAAHVAAPMRVLAVTRPENLASQAMFRGCGYLGETDFVKDLGGVQSPAATTTMGKP